MNISLSVSVAAFFFHKTYSPFQNLENKKLGNLETTKPGDYETIFNLAYHKLKFGLFEACGWSEPLSSYRSQIHIHFNLNFQRGS